MKIHAGGIKKKRHIIVNLLISIVLIGIIANQTVWLNNMYNLFEREFTVNANQSLKDAAFMEMNERGESLGGFTVYASNFSSPNDTSSFFLKKIVTADSTYTFAIDKNDPNAMHKIVQFVLKSHLPVNLERLSTLFKKNMHWRYVINKAYFDYLDLESDTLISTNRPEKTRTDGYILTDTFPLDIANTIGIIGHVENPRTVILDTMKKQLMLSVSLIIIGLMSLCYISRSFVVQWKTERMRQESVNAMTHEFKRPIASAVAMASLIPFYLERGEKNKALDYVKNIEMDLNKLTQYTKRIQQISNNEKQYVTMNRTDVEIVPFFESLQKRYAVSDDPQRKIIVNLMIETHKQIMCVDMLHFSNVMDNLLENAIKYTVKPVVTIDINVTDTPNGLKMSIKDNGIGISASDKKLIFDKFYRVKRTETKSKTGFGLGLTYAKSIVEAHGGIISVSSELNKGSEFVVIFQE